MPGTKFLKVDLPVAIARLFDHQIAKLRLELEAEKAVSDKEIRDQWREAETAKVFDLAESLRNGTCDDITLTNFRIIPTPYREQKYSISRLEEKIVSLEKRRERALTIVDAMAANENGVVELMTADLKRLGLTDE